MNRFTVPVRPEQTIHVPPPTVRIERRQVNGSEVWGLVAVGFGFVYTFPLDCPWEQVEGWLKRHKYQASSVAGEYLRKP